MTSKGHIFHTEVKLDNAKRSSGTQKVKFDIDFLGCIECSKQSLIDSHVPFWLLLNLHKIHGNYFPRSSGYR